MSPPLHLFEGFGIEIEYMCVAADSLAVLPVVDRVLTAANGGTLTGEVERGAMAWSNELTLHLLEMKSNGPVPRLAGAAAAFQAEVAAANALLAPLGGRLLPGGMHPTMDPDREMRLWPHDYSVVYAAFDRIFDCRGHGWANLQATHLNLPFAGADEFGRLHAAIRVLLPLLPALSAASPVRDGRPTGWCDTRLDVYRGNAARIPLVSGAVVPEPAFTPEAYQREILQPLYRAIAPHDPEGVLQEEWLNARGAIARFDREAIEIRVLDAQECPAADLALCAAAVAVLRALVDERLAPGAAQRAQATERLAALFWAVARDADRAPVDDPGYRALLGLPAGVRTAGDAWRHLLDRFPPSPEPAVAAALGTILERGPLARRLLAALGEAPDRARIDTVWRRLAEALAAGVPFLP
jgi:gamma-glutamyl:cysteine ligase YbdK (ATP-grasp superfamily)